MDDEPERQLPLRTPQPPKRPLAEFLAEFEQRLAETPDRPATDVHLALEARVEGARRLSSDARPPLPATPDPGPVAPGAIATDPTAEIAPAQASEAAADGAPQAGSPLATPAAAPAAEQKRHRGRRHRRRRH